MSFEEAYGHYNYDPYQAGSSGFAGGQGPYYPADMHQSYGPQVGPSSSAHFDYEVLILRSIRNLLNRISTLGTQQQQMQDTMAHNTQLTQESWGLTSALQYDVSNVFIHLGLFYQQSQPYQPYQPPEQENNEEEEENNNDNEEDKHDDEEDPDEGEQDSDEED
jgi:hypothetical protein